MRYCSECNTALSKVRYRDDIYTEYNMKTVCRAAVAQWIELLTRASSNLERPISAYTIGHRQAETIKVSTY